MSKANAAYMRQYRKLKNSENQSQAAHIVAEIEESYRVAKERLEQGLTEVLPGSNAHTKIVEAIARLDRERRDELASRGITPKLLGGAVRTGFHFICHVGAGGSVHTVAYDSENAFTQALAKERAKIAAQAEKLDTPEQRAAVEELDAEFPTDDTGVRTKDDAND
jgi:hypothetical protein